MTTLKRKYEVLSHSKRQLEELYDLLRDRSSEEADEILRRIRAGHSLGEILQTTQDGALLDRQDETTPMQLDDHGPSTQTVTLAQLRARHARAYYDFQPRRSSLSVRDRMKVDSLLACASAESPECELTVFSPDQRTARQQEAWSGYVDPTLNSSRLEEWTSVTDDNDLLKHLVSMFFAFESPQWMFFIREQFISDLVHQKTTFCSSMLFNSICAYACVSSLITLLRDSTILTAPSTSVLASQDVATPTISKIWVPASGTRLNANSRQDLEKTISLQSKPLFC